MQESKGWVVLVTFLGFCLSAKSFAQQERLNILFIPTDDLDYMDLGAYGNLYNETPHLDSLTKNEIN
ncbi:hypothetical protein ACFOSV_09115 [Algoriphagus namhaensis]|uniref:Uncharacterized protein n=1 Tax=Algoriphagus namhaensis TaxID=915353 RepID=A0ABV8AQV5_9BACT